MEEELHRRDQPHNQGQHRSHLQQLREPPLEAHRTAASRRRCRRLRYVNVDAACHIHKSDIPS